MEFPVIVRCFRFAQHLLHKKTENASCKEQYFQLHNPVFLIMNEGQEGQMNQKECLVSTSLFILLPSKTKLSLSFENQSQGGRSPIP